MVAYMLTTSEWPGPKLISIDSDAVICGVVIGQSIED